MCEAITRAASVLSRRIIG